jgi:predicted  nucleic acid-binding Zn-ribbon protein
MHPDIHLVIQLQTIDLKIADLEKEIAQLPKHIAEIEKALDSHKRKLEADKAALAANQRERKTKEGDIQAHQQKISKLRDQMVGAKTNEQYRAFQHEIEYIENEIRKAEDRILDLMTESEPLEANVKAAELALKQEAATVDAEKQRARERTAADQKMVAEGREERVKVAASLPAPTAAAYERIRKKWHGVAVSEIVGGRCTACQIVNRPQFMQELKRRDSLKFCESCGRIVYINAPVSFDGFQGGTRVDMT